MAFESINPANGQLLKTFDDWDSAKLASVLTEVRAATASWQATTLETRCQLMIKAGAIIRERQHELAHLITLEMG
ncbi:MAG: aldehyde dehydrogenase family protein, partial [Gammaproteobacteria bacterium]|nr:aldehyde dehydrogenase family protein [Gammaproteobacteria bacterium]